MIADAPKVRVRTIVIDGLVAAVDGGQIVLNVGKRAGVNVGDQLEVVRVTKEIKDPGDRRGDPPADQLHRHHQGHGCRRCFGGVHAGLGLRVSRPGTG